MALTEKKIREKILDVIQSVCPDAKRILRNPFTQDRSKWAGLFRHEVEINAQMVVVTHGWIVRRSSYDPSIKTKFEKMTFELLGFRGFDFGIEGSNSEDIWQQIIDSLALALKDDDVWDFDDESDEVVNEELKFNPIGLIPAGTNEFLHFAGGKLTVNVFRC